MAQQQMPNPVPLYEAAAEGFRKTLASVKSGQMRDATPCTEWNVQSLINHNIKGASFVHGILTQNANVTVNPFAVDEPLPPEGALVAFDAGITRVLDQLKTAGALDKELQTPFGRMTGAQFLFAPMLELLIHRWDLAKGTRQDTTLDSSLVEVALAVSTPQMMEVARSRKFAGPEIPVPNSARPQDRLLGIWGRKP